MIFVLHYLLLNAGLPAIIILLALYLQTYSNASLSEIGALLMVLPFVSIFVKPLFCALADRQQAHRLYLVGSLLLTAAGYGSLVIAPLFFPDFVKQHGRLVWYLDIVGIVIGFSAFGVVWSLGDALSVAAAKKNGVSWGFYRVWGTVSWGVFGYVIGLINETPLLPKYVPAFLLLIGSLVAEAILLAVWPNKYFDMNVPELTDEDINGGAIQLGEKKEPNGDNGFDLNDTWPANKSLTGTISGSARMNPRLMSAMAGMMMEDFGSTLKSSLRGGPQRQRTGLADILEQHKMSANAPVVAMAAARSPLVAHRQCSIQGSPLAQRSPSLANWSQSQINQQRRDSSIIGSPKTLGRAAIRQASLALSRMNSLSMATGHAIADDYEQEFPSSTPQTQRKHQQMMIMSSLASNASLGQATESAARALGVGGTIQENPADEPAEKLSKLKSVDLNSSSNGYSNSSATTREPSAAVANGLHQHSNLSKLADESLNSIVDEEVDKYVQDLQMLLLKLIVKRNQGILKYLVMFVLFGILFTAHLSYFFLNVEQICQEKGEDFSQVMGVLVVAQSVSEIFCFIVVVPYYMPRVGRLGSLLTCSIIFAIRFAFYGTYYSQMSPYTGIVTETAHGLAYAMIYSLITDYASDCVEELDDYLPELIARGLVDPSINPNQLKLPLRATMQGVFSGAFDGLGNGLGALFAGIYLDSYSFTSLWLICAYISLAITIIYPLTEIRICCRSPRT